MLYLFYDQVKFYSNEMGDPFILALWFSAFNQKFCIIEHRSQVSQGHMFSFYFHSLYMQSIIVCDYMYNSQCWKRKIETKNKNKFHKNLKKSEAL